MVERTTDDIVASVVFLSTEVSHLSPTVSLAPGSSRQPAPPGHPEVAVQVPVSRSDFQNTTLSSPGP